MKTVVERSSGLGRPFSFPIGTKYPVLEDLNQERSCFYDYGARNPVEFSGFVEQEDSAFIDELEQCFN